LAERRSPAQHHWIKINRAPVLALWASVVAERLGCSRAEAVTLGRAVAGLNAYSKGKSLGIFKPSTEKVKETRRGLPRDEIIHVDLLGRAVPTTLREGELRAVSKGKAIPPESVERYLEGKFGAAMEETREAMRSLSKAYKPGELAAQAYGLYVQFRPEIPRGKKGWGAEGRLSIDRIRRLAARS
jgi:hypothetical protein